ncbi:choline-sulfatase [Allopusillimonas soli]|uniref:Choline-sulfatase n=1 Tax=Allopusillimonas soli TaxID=659016 RepID=A0A853F818_9BURK|nr:choline-sulfatase [Allopusillimonas soli]NYT36127.1 choline-sulfatase [Allopusillimonas soli]TEA76462.1 choline-sulfatase [Allopusillimonas soli]
MKGSSSPNILFLMADQLTAFALRLYGNSVCRTPNIDRLAKRATLFTSMYCNFPLCAPSRVAMLTGRLPSEVGVYDNASEFPADTPTFLHYLKLAGYSTVLSGKMHFVGPDQQHGFQERLTTDIYPSDFGWTPDWRQEVPIAPTGMNMRSVVEAGVCRRSMQLDYDDDVVNRGIQKIYDLGRLHRDHPFFLGISLTHPHNPYVSTGEYMDLYRRTEIDMPVVRPIPFEEQDAHSQRLWFMFRQDEYKVTDEHVRTARHAYYAMVSYVDAQVGRILEALEAMDLDDSTAVILTSDHGDMLGERGLWYKWSHFEHAVRIPLLVSLPGQTHARVESALASLVDIFPTLMDIAGIDSHRSQLAKMDGRSLFPFLSTTEGHEWTVDDSPAVYGEMNGEGAHAPCLMVRSGKWKLIASEGDPPLLYNLEDDPHEIRNLAQAHGFAAERERLMQLMQARWDSKALRERIIESQKRRHLIQRTLLTGDYRAWDYQPRQDASKLYVRAGAQSSPSVVKGRLRYPNVTPTAPDTPRSDT